MSLAETYNPTQAISERITLPVELAVIMESPRARFIAKAREELDFWRALPEVVGVGGGWVVPLVGIREISNGNYVSGVALALGGVALTIGACVSTRNHIGSWAQPAEHISDEITVASEAVI